MKKIIPIIFTAVLTVGCIAAPSTAFAEKYNPDNSHKRGNLEDLIAAFLGNSDGDRYYDGGHGYDEDRYYDEWDDEYYEDDSEGNSWGSFFSDLFDDDYDEDYDDYEGNSWGGFRDDDYDDDSYHSVDEQADESELLTWESGIGSAGILDGNIVVVSIYVNDKNTSWDFSDRRDISTRSDTLDYLNLATEWISQQGRYWGKNPVFICDWEQCDGLYYETTIKSDVTSNDGDSYEDVCKYIERKIDSDELMEMYNAESIVYMTFYNTSYRNETVSFTYPFDDEMEYPYEICYITVRSEGEDEAPAAYAHEMLHTFGAPDLYTSESPEYNYNIVNDFVNYCEKYYPNEIMLTTYDADTAETYYDRISNELTHLTAYFVGWTNECEEVEQFNLQPSQYVLTGRVK